MSNNTRGPWRVTGPEKIYNGEVIKSGDDWVAVVSDFNRYDRDAEREANAALIAAAPDLYNALLYLNHMGGDDRGGYCICPKHDGSAPDEQHATSCADARKALRKACVKELG